MESDNGEAQEQYLTQGTEGLPGLTPLLGPPQGLKWKANRRSNESAEDPFFKLFLNSFDGNKIQKMASFSVAGASSCIARLESPRKAAIHGVLPGGLRRQRVRVLPRKLGLEGAHREGL